MILLWSFLASAVLCMTLAGIKALRHYRREWNEAAQTWRSSPVHDFASHGSDSFRYLALGVREVIAPKVEIREPVRLATAGGNSWMGL